MPQRKSQFGDSQRFQDKARTLRRHHSIRRRLHRRDWRPPKFLIPTHWVAQRTRLRQNRSEDPPWSRARSLRHRRRRVVFRGRCHGCYVRHAPALLFHPNGFVWDEPDSSETARIQANEGDANSADWPQRRCRFNHGVEDPESDGVGDQESDVHGRESARDGNGKGFYESVRE